MTSTELSGHNGAAASVNSQLGQRTQDLQRPSPNESHSLYTEAEVGTRTQP